MVKSMTAGSPFKLILRFSLPVMLGSLLQQLYSMADTLIVGRFVGKTALAAVGETAPISFLILGFALGIAEGACVLVAQFFGAKDEAALKKCVGNILYVCLAVALGITALMLIFNRPLLLLMRTPADIIDGSEAYLRVIYIGIAASVFYNVLAGLLRALGDSRTPLFFLIVSSVLNVGLDLLFVLVFKQGVSGAAIATVLSQFVSAVGCLFYIAKNCPLLHLSKKDLLPDGRMIRRIVAMALPMALQYSVTALGTIVVQAAMNPLGSDTVAAVTCWEKIFDFFWPTANSVGIAVANYSGQNIGAGELTRVRRGVRAAGILIAGYVALFMIVFSAFGTPLALLFLEGGDTAAVEPLIRQLSFAETATLPALALIALFRNTVQGTGHSVCAMIGGLVELVSRAAIVLLLIDALGFTAICYASPAAWITAGVYLCISYFVIMGKTRRAFLDMK